MESISAIKSNEKLRHLSEEQEEENESETEAKEQLKQHGSSILSLDEILERRETWIE
jgi:hypothetical protein